VCGWEELWEIFFINVDIGITPWEVSTATRKFESHQCIQQVVQSTTDDSDSISGRKKGGYETASMKFSDRHIRELIT